MGLFTNPAAGEAKNTYNQAYNTANMLGANASNINANLTPFLTQEMLHPQGYGQQGLSAMTAAAEGGAGGATSGLTGQAEQRAAASHNAGGYQAALDAAARERTKAAAGASENIAAQNANLQQHQMQAGAQGLQGLYGTDTSGMLNAMGQQSRDIQTQLQANAAPAPWMSALSNTMGLIGQAGKLASGFAPGSQMFGGFAGGR